MECRQRGAISDEEMLAYLAGEEVRPAVLEHLATCPACATQVESYRRLELTLLQSLYRWDCPPAQVLGEYYLGLLNKEVAVAVRFHLATCQHCTAELAVLSHFLSGETRLAEASPLSDLDLAELELAASLALEQEEEERSVEDERGEALPWPSSWPLDDGPPQVRPLASARAGRPSLGEQMAAGARRIVATLLAPQPRLAYQRDLAQAEQAGPRWPRRYSAEDFSISLHVEQGSSLQDGLELIGFVTRKGTALEALQGTPVLLTASSGTVRSGRIDELGNFLFSSLAPETYTLELQFPEGTVVIESLQLALSE
ncbi:anti-sigma factor family protein [Thermogemmatispora sp.]|uniref:anti-sigma factor family protein n=1 Tax=Thermogemmatispora sp. TaxID=1968838 RepID=UPI0035E40C0A